MTNPTVEQLMSKVHAAATDDPPEPSFPLLKLDQMQPTLRETSVVIGRPPLIGRTPYERVWAVINRLLRRAAVHAVEPAVAQQNEWNAAVHATITDLARTQSALQAEVIRQQAERVTSDE